MKAFVRKVLVVMVAAFFCSCEEHNQVFQSHLTQEIELNELRAQAKEVESQVALFGADPVQAGKDIEQKIAAVKASNEALEMEILGLQITKQQLEQAVKTLRPRLEALKKGQVQ